MHVSDGRRENDTKSQFSPTTSIYRQESSVAKQQGMYCIVNDNVKTFTVHTAGSEQYKWPVARQTETDKQTDRQRHIDRQTDKHTACPAITSDTLHSICTTVIQKQYSLPVTVFVRWYLS